MVRSSFEPSGDMTPRSGVAIGVGGGAAIGAAAIGAGGVCVSKGTDALTASAADAGGAAILAGIGAAVAAVALFERVRDINSATSVSTDGADADVASRGMSPAAALVCLRTSIH